MSDLKSICVLLLCLQLAASRPNSDSETDDNAELIFAHVVYRHGDRNPITSYPTDPYKDEANWPQGYGALTNTGKRQHYLLGKYLRRRYASLLGDGKYSPNTVYIQSTDVDRTIMSAASNLAGLFPPLNDDEIWNPNISWQPIPVHVVPKRYDYVVYGDTHCPRLNEAQEKYKKSPEYTNIFVKYKPLIEYLEENTGFALDDLGAIEDLYNTLFVQSIKNKTSPEWTKKVFPGGDFGMLAGLSFAVNTSTPILARLKIGFLLREVLDRFEQKIASELQPNRTLWIYSAHDSTIASILNSIGLFKPAHIPPYASSLLIELYKLKNEFYFQIFYRKEDTDELLPLDIPLCGTKCSIGKFREAYKDIIPTGSYEEECGL